MESGGFGILIKRVRRKNDTVVMSGICAMKLDAGIGRPDLSRLVFRIRGEEEVPVRSSFSWGKGLPFVMGYRLRRFRLEIDVRDALQLDIQNKLDVWYGEDHVSDVSYDVLARRTGAFRNTRPMPVGDKVMYFRQSVTNAMWFVVRERNLYDDPARRFRVFWAWLAAKVMGRGDHILMYEKGAARYEESASVVYEKLMDMGYDNVWYIVNRDNPAIRDLPEKYRSHLIEKDSFRHLLMFFRCEKFVGTETVDHAMQLRAADRRIMSKTQSRDLTHVFLQHGVMYMVSLDADLRVGFVNRKVRKYRTVVSSEAEAMHFVTLGGFPREELYVTGLAKFDRSVSEPGADLIMIMPTWRRWEANLAQRDFTKTGYYRMLERIVEAVPEELKEKIVIKPHPLMQAMMEKEETPLSAYLRSDMSHDDVLKRTRLLITDYSSIAYDAFYRGANVIFCWEDKTECMKHYGGAHLMINEYNIFGDICYDCGGMRPMIEENYASAQKPLYLRRYGNIVSFRDGRNTERIIGMMKKDGII